MKKIKGFTLVELIIVMAILAILMTAIIQLFKPIRDTYVDATLYESQRTTQNGVVTYISESIRFATDLGLYSSTKSASSTADKAVDEFTKKYIDKYGVDPSKTTDVKKAIKKNAQIIVIDNPKIDTTDRSNPSKNPKAYLFNNRYYTGRILRRKLPGNETSVVEPTGTDIAKSSQAPYWREALGSAYYGDRDYYVSFDVSGAVSDGIGITVASVVNTKAKSGSGKNTVDTTDLSKMVHVSGSVQCKNLFAGEHGVKNAGVFDTEFFDSGTQVTPGTKIYIVYLDLAGQTLAKKAAA